MKRKYTSSIIIIIISVCLVKPGFSAEQVPVFVSIVPQKYFVQQIGKDLVNVQVMVQPGASPATYEPRPRQMAALSKAKLYFSIGVQFEKTWLEKLAAVNPNMQVVPTDHGIEKIAMTAHHHPDEAEHNHDKAVEPHKSGLKQRHKGHDEAQGQDPHIWLSPSLVAVQAHTILSALQKVDPSHDAVYQKNYNTFVSTLGDLDTELKATFAGQRGLSFMVFHPSWGYFAQDYGLQQIPIEIEGKSPKPAQLKALIRHARGKNIRVVFVQPQFSTKSAGLIAKEIDGRVIVTDPLAEDWLANLRSVAAKFKIALD